MSKKKQSGIKTLKKKIKTLEPKAGVSFLLMGLLMICLGIYVWFHPIGTLVALAMYLGVGFIIVGAGYIAMAMTFKSGWYMSLGLLDIFVGIIFLTNLSVTAESLPIIFALWTLFVGIIQVAEAFHRKGSGYPWNVELVMGIIGILFAFLIIAEPAIGMFTITILMGSYIVLYGILGIIGYKIIRGM